jgi:hypothetical protein
MTTYYMDDARVGAVKFIEDDGTTQIAACDANATDYDNVSNPYLCVMVQFYPYVVAGACNKDITASAVKLQFKQDDGAWEDVTLSGGRDVDAYDVTGLTNDADYTTDECGDPSAGGCTTGWANGKQCTDGAISIGVTKEHWSAIIFGVDMTNAVEGSTYYFRLYDTDNSNPVQHVSDATGQLQASITTATNEVNVPVGKQDLTLAKLAAVALTSSTILVSSLALSLGISTASVSAYKELEDVALYKSAGVVSVNKTTLSLTPNGVAVSAGNTVAVNKQNLSLSAQSAAASISGAADVSAQSLSLSVNAAQISAGNSPSVNKQDLTLAPQAVSLSTGNAFEVEKQDLTLSVNAASVSTADVTTVPVSNVSLTLTLNSAATALSSSVPVNKLDLTLSPKVVSLSLSSAPGAAKQDLTLAANPATASGADAVTVPVASQSLTLAVNAPALSLSSSPAVSKQDLTITPKNVSVSIGGGATIPVAKQDLTLATKSISVSIDKSIAVAAQALSITINGVTLDIQDLITVAVNKQSLTLSAKTASVNSGAGIAVSKQDLSLTALSATAQISIATGEFTAVFSAKQPTMEVEALLPSVSACARSPLIIVKS